MENPEEMHSQYRIIAYKMMFVVESNHRECVTHIEIF